MPRTLETVRYRFRVEHFGQKNIACLENHAFANPQKPNPFGQLDLMKPPHL